MLTLFTHIRANIYSYSLLTLLIISIVLWGVVLHEGERTLTFALLNIGQGDALFVESPTGTQVLIDGGPNNTLMREIPKMIPWYDKHIDMLIVTNPDKDHYEGFISLLKHYSVDVVMEPGVVSKTDTYAALNKEVKEKNIPIVLAMRGQVIDLGGGAYIEILFPDRDAPGLSSNDGSIVAKLVYGKTSVMLQGDSTAKIEDYLIKTDGDSLKATILKAGHHGSRTSSAKEYVEAVSPEYTVMSSGKENSYGHPHKETLDTLAELHVPALDTCAMGEIIFHSNGEKFKLETKMVPVSVGCK